MDRAEAVVEITEWVEVPRKNLTADNSTSASANTTDAEAKNTSEESTDKLETSNGDITNSDSSTNDSSNVDLGTEKKLKKRTFRVPLKVFKINNFHLIVSSFLSDVKNVCVLHVGY